MLYTVERLPSHLLLCHCYLETNACSVSCVLLFTVAMCCYSYTCSTWECETSELYQACECLQKFSHGGSVQHWGRVPSMSAAFSKRLQKGKAPGGRKPFWRKGVSQSVRQRCVLLHVVVWCFPQVTRSLNYAYQGTVSCTFQLCHLFLAVFLLGQVWKWPHYCGY